MAEDEGPTWDDYLENRISSLEKKIENLINTEAKMNKIYIERIEKLEKEGS